MNSQAAITDSGSPCAQLLFSLQHEFFVLVVGRAVSLHGCRSNLGRVRCWVASTPAVVADRADGQTRYFHRDCGCGTCTRDSGVFAQSAGPGSSARTRDGFVDATAASCTSSCFCSGPVIFFTTCGSWPQPISGLQCDRQQRRHGLFGALARRRIC